MRRTSRLLVNVKHANASVINISRTWRDRKGGTHVGLGLPSLRDGARRGWVARPRTTLFPFPLTHTYLSSTTSLLLDVR